MSDPKLSTAGAQVNIAYGYRAYTGAGMPGCPSYGSMVTASVAPPSAPGGSFSSGGGADAEALTDDAIYFASLPVFFKRVPGEVIPFDDTTWLPSSDSLDAALSRFAPIPAPDGGLPLVQPAIPALDLVRSEESITNMMRSVDRRAMRLVQAGSTGDVSAYAVPDELLAPLIKVRAEDAPADALLGVASGCRSALLKIKGAWYRLKGCGNNDQGLTVKTEKQRLDDGGFLEFRQVRGCAFPHTAVRELSVSARVMSALAPLGAAGANQPIAFANYSDSEQLPFGEAIQTSCIIERTLGDRRLGSHVLSGLELLLPLLIDASKLDFSALRGAFPAARPLELDTVVDTSSFIADHVLGATYARTADADTVACFGLKPFYDGGAGLAFNGLPRDATTLASLSTAAAASAALRAAERAPSATAKPPAQYTVAGPREMTPQWLPLWRKCCDDLNEALAVLPPTRSLLSYVYARLGADAGACIRGLHNAGINWGTYQDAFCNVRNGAFHCNAHSNNLVLIAPGTLEPAAPGSQRLVALLDLDMAFTADTFVNGFPIETATRDVGMAADKFESLNFWEYLNLLEVLAGGDSSNGVPQVAKAGAKAASTPATILAKNALVDTLVLAFRAAYEGGSSFTEAEPFDASMHTAAHALLKLAVIVMADFAA